MTKAKMAPYVWLGLGVAGLAYLSEKENRDKAMELMSDLKHRAVSFWCKQQPDACHDLLAKAGHPDPNDIPDNKMVDEGAMYSVKYYNEEKQ